MTSSKSNPITKDNLNNEEEQNQAILVLRSNPTQHKILTHLAYKIPSNTAPSSLVEPSSQAAVFTLRLLRFSLTANNITYCTLGSHPRFRYFDFFSPGSSHPTLGSINVWGIARVLKAAPSGREAWVGKYVYGYFPLQRFVEFEADRVVQTREFHVRREGLADAYNSYKTLDSHPFYKIGKTHLILSLSLSLSLSLFLSLSLSLSLFLSLSFISNGNYFSYEFSMGCHGAF
jgi:hypothetical protein